MPIDLNTAWEHEEHWTQRGDGFHVTVTRRVQIANGCDGRGPHRWSVATTLSSAHPWFSAFQGDDFQQEAAMALPLYQGPCFLHRVCDAQGRPYQVQVGTEYLEEGYTLQPTQEDAPLVFRDAEELFRWLRARGTTAGS